MINLILRTLAGLVLLAASAAGMAVTMDITASFSPSMDKPENNTFTNTTPQSGFCAIWPSECTGGEKSLATGLTLAPSRGLTPQDDKRESLFFKWPSSLRNVTVTNTETGRVKTVQFRVSSFSGRYYANSQSQIYEWGEGSSAFSMHPRGGCRSLSPGWIIGDSAVAWLWSVPEGNTGCYRITSVERPVGGSNFINKVVELSLGYELKTPNPLKMDAGIYTGTLTLSVGPGGDIDFGDNFQASATELTINFTLSVNHELKLTTTAENQAVSLQPCAPGRVCTEDEGQANWERWMVTRITPQLTGRSNFRLSSSGSFTVYLECEKQSGPDCALRSDKTPSQTVPVKTLLTLPDNIVDNLTGSTVSKRRLEAGSNLTKNVFLTKTFGENSAGSIDFLVSQKDVDTMLTTRPDTYRGAITVIFDPNIY
ncbi:hypothetical protein H2241_22665 [Pantoea ananatis]|uniref:hypothetical protein n=1 Tax=Pantoea ananas TaxID=553 RepID=UPI0015896B0D|nr:hypothetical protein [Pantoea ananatis]MBA4823728.1 hypothetical protein [Pantoea ananatis]QKV85975.1 hypothetical protein FOB88_01900 [Pantoea ananatis]